MPLSMVDVFECVGRSHLFTKSAAWGNNGPCQALVVSTLGLQSRASGGPSSTNGGASCASGSSHNQGRSWSLSPDFPFNPTLTSPSCITRSVHNCFALTYLSHIYLPLNPSAFLRSYPTRSVQPVKMSFQDKAQHQISQIDKEVREHMSQLFHLLPTNTPPLQVDDRRPLFLLKVMLTCGHT